MIPHPHPRRALQVGRGARIALASLLALASVACADNAVNAADSADEEEQLLFVRTVTAGAPEEWTAMKKDIHRMNADGTGIENLTQHPAYIYSSLSLTRDGTKLAFNSDRSGCYDLWTMNTDGTNPVQLTGPFAEHRCNFTPRWSLDGTRIAFASTRARNWATYVMNADGSEPHIVSSPVESEAVNTFPAGWSRYDGRVAFHALFEDNTLRTYVVNADGSDLEPLFDRAGDYFPHWSPDGAMVAFISDRGGSQKLYVMNSDGSGVRKLSTLGGDDYLPYGWASLGSEVSPWSPDGTRIAFENFEGMNRALYVINADGSGLRRLTEPEASPSIVPFFFNGWSPSGTRIAFSSTAAGSYDVYVVNADGTGRVNLTNSPENEADAVWLPRR